MPSVATVLEIDIDGNISVVMNHNEAIVQQAELIFTQTNDSGIIKDCKLRYLRDGNRIAVVDISMEYEMLKISVLNSLSIFTASMIVFFTLSVFLAHWAVRPMEIAWERQKQFIGNASHELKTPLTVILSNADILRKDDLRAEHIYFEAVRMKKLVEDMLILAKSDSSETSVTRVVTDFSDIVKSAVLTYEPVAYDNYGGKLFSYDIKDSLFVMGNITLLQQVIYILFDNALKYSPDGSTIQVKLSKHEHRALLLTVTNYGEVIPQAELESIFLRFYRRDESRNDDSSFGLGLSIAQGIVNEHKGKIWAESDEQMGNSFFVTLPIEKEG
jgi:Osmosensitive K+ channel histidine kinase